MQFNCDVNATRVWLSYPDVAGADERRLALKVLGVGNIADVVTGLKQEARQVNLASVDGIQ